MLLLEKDWGMGRRLRALAALAEDSGVVPSTPVRQLTTLSNSSSRGSHASGFIGYLLSHARTHIQTCPLKIIIFLKGKD